MDTGKNITCLPEIIKAPSDCHHAKYWRPGTAILGWIDYKCLYLHICFLINVYLLPATCGILSWMGYVDGKTYKPSFSHKNVKKCHYFLPKCCCTDQSFAKVFLIYSFIYASPQLAMNIRCQNWFNKTLPYLQEERLRSHLSNTNERDMKQTAGKWIVNISCAWKTHLTISPQHGNTDFVFYLVRLVLIGD